MPILNWIGKEKIVNHDKEVPFRLLRKNKKYSFGKSENLIIEGDNLEALKALMPFYYGKINSISGKTEIFITQENNLTNHIFKLTSVLAYSSETAGKFLEALNLSKN